MGMEIEGDEVMDASDGGKKQGCWQRPDQGLFWEDLAPPDTGKGESPGERPGGMGTARGTG